MYDFTNGEFSENMTRVANLVSASQNLAAQGSDNVEPAKDVLRAAVAFLHSSLEEIVRNLFLYRLPNVDAESLNKIPIAAHPSTHRPKSIQLGDLLGYRGRFVDNVIVESINQYVNTLNINDTHKLVACLELAQVPVEPVNTYFPALELLMKRRHQIVHQMDRLNELDPLTSPIDNIEVETVEVWRNSLNGFAQSLFSIVPSPNSGT